MKEFYFDQAGSGEPVIFVHGWGFHSGVWQRQVEFFKKDFRVVTVDLPGHGASLPASQRLTIRFCARALEELIRENGFTGVHLVGWSLGAEVIVRSSQALGGKIVRSLALVGGTPAFLPREGFHDPRAERKKAKVFEQALLKNFEVMRSKFIRSCVNLKQEDREELSHPLLSFLASIETLPLDKPSAMALLESLYEDDMRDEMNEIQFPSLICHGNRDGIIPVEASALWRGILVNSRVEIFKDGGHAVFLEEPEKFNQTLKDFFEKL